MQPVPLVIRGDGPAAQAFRDLVDREGGDLAGREGFQLADAAVCGPHPSIVVDAADDSSALTEIVAAVWSGHAAVTANLDALTGDPAVWGVLAADRRVGVSAALLPGLPLVELLTDLALTGTSPVTVELHGDDAVTLAAEAVAVARLLGRELRTEQVPVLDHATGPPFVATVGDRFPTITAGQQSVTAAGERSVRVRMSDRDEVTMRGTVGTPERVAAALFHDVVALAREGDRPWRAHRRRASLS
jgi:hypothetical protein